jgi:hypothetical protein
MKNSIFFIFLLTILTVYPFVQAYSQSDLWNFSNSCYITFNDNTFFSNEPHQGVLNDSSLIGYWNMDEDWGSIVYDTSGLRNNGTLNECTRVTGKYGQAISFNGSVNSGITTPLNLPLKPTQLTLAAWVNLSSSNSAFAHWIVGKSWGYSWGMYVNSQTGRIGFYGHSSNAAVSAESTACISFGSFHFIALEYSDIDQKIAFFIDGANVGTTVFNYTLGSSTNSVSIGNIALNYNTWRANGTIDDVRIYNRTLSNSEISALALMGPFSTPNQTLFQTYYNFTDSLTNNTMLIYIYNPTNDYSDITIVNCPNFFQNNKILFNSNGTSIINIWTNLGTPVFTSGAWNKNNYTVTVAVNSSAVGELDWNPSISPFTYDFLTSTTLSGNDTVVSVQWNDNRSLSGGGYIFSTNNTGQWVNSTWQPFISSPAWANTTLALKNAIGATIGFREYANNTLNLWGDSGIYTITTTATYITKPTPTLTPLPSATATPTLTATPIVTPTINPILTGTLSPTSTIAENPSVLNEIMLLITITIIAIFVTLVLSFKKGIIKIEIINEQNSGSEDNHQI